MLREFDCIKCGHHIVVNPKLPLDYMPTICTPCYNADAPLRDTAERKIMEKVAELLKLCDLPNI